MSRCFPFPPPGYETKFKAENLDLLTKDKVRKKKHKKEKKGKDKKEHKEKREKDRSKDKHKEKKDRKEKRKERKKHKEIDKGRTPEDSTAETRTEGQHEFNVREILQEEGGKDSKFAEELGRRTRDDGAANRLAGSITSSIPCPLEMERSSDKKAFLVHNIGSAQGNYGSCPPVESFTNPLQRRTENISTATSMENERSKMHERPPFVINTMPNRNHGIPRPDGISWLVNRKTECPIAGMEKEKSGEKNTIPNSIVSPLERGQLGARVVAWSSTSTQRNNHMGLAVENHSFRSKTEDIHDPSVHSRMDVVCAVPSIEKERVKGREMFTPQLSFEQRTKATVGQPVEKDRYQKLDGKDADENRKDEYRKGVKDSDSEKSRAKHTDKHSNDKEKWEKIAKFEKIEQRNFVKKDQVDTLSSKPLAPHKENTAGIKDAESMKRRNDTNTNGFIHENDARPSKMPRLFQSSTPTDPPFSLPLKDGAMNNSKKPDRTLDNNEKKINGTGKSHLQAIDGRPPADRGPLENGDVALRSPHPDSKYLPHIYTVPKTEEMSEIDDMDWLFNCCDSRQKPTPKHEHAPLVWAEALWIDSADVLALPYVVPF
ncbi:hypothetical protein KSP40_PGU009577 [Platanthera guangdongensis]|uniref:Uncharacterized protein n=1 Tax=Platanthera guangdongensis TaxID=2320717 RepID=A0ABR2MSC0_9ASPA